MAETLKPGTRVPAVPPSLEPPAGHVLFFQGHAEGTQNYICLATSSGMAWTFIGPQATLYRAFKGELHQQLTTHFLSGNPSEAGLLRPTWQHSVDTSRVWARSLAASSDPAFVEPGAIPWLLLQAAGVEKGPDRGPFLAQTAFIQRLNTSGGLAPAIGCTQPTQTGTMVFVPYAADYLFYKARHRR
jgi:hypothetical protein